VPGAAAAAPKSDELASLRKLVAAVVASVLHLPLGHADVQDAVQECMRRAVEGRSRLRDGEPLRPWVVGIARHVALDVHRARKRQPSALPESDASAPELEIADPAPSALERFASEEQSRAVRQALSTLPEGARRALTMFHLEGKRYEEISVALGVPMGTVATWMARGRKAVAQAMRREPEPS
jgi:RNA polymerase sigma-70 factor (ECF subfamily)